MVRPSSQIVSTKAGDQFLRRPAAGAERLPLLPGGLPLRPATSLRFLLGVKETLDRSLAVVLLVAALPVMLLSMLLVKLTSRGPTVYSQQRVGQFGRVFTIYKIRTMIHNCESKTGPRWSTPKDPRVTTVGKVLRALHVDELPQLWNVLTGEMSLLGPRPERPEIAAKLRQSIEDYDWRAAFKPGISGLAQIHLPPDTSLQSVREKLVLDRQYIRNISIWFDCKLFVKTALKFLGSKPRRPALPALAGNT